MSAWQVGSQAGRRAGAAAPQAQPAWVDRLIKWIPGDVLVLYTAGIAALRTQVPDPNPSIVLLIIGTVAAPVIAWRPGLPSGEPGATHRSLRHSCHSPPF